MPRIPTAQSATRPATALAIAAVLTCGIVTPGRAAAPALDPVPAATRAEGRAIVTAMKEALRGPYQSIRWFCADGAVLPPKPFACVERGGGKQYAVFAPSRDRLATLGWSVGTIFAASSFEELFDADRRNQRLRELSLERYLTDVDDGWVLRRAQYYRGRVQVEDEEVAGRAILTALLSSSSWVGENFFLARETARVIPHANGGDRTRSVRRVAADIASRDSSFESLRVKIHSSPGVEDARAVRRWYGKARERGVDPVLLSAAEGLARDLDQLFGGIGRADRLAEHTVRLGTPEARALFGDLVVGLFAQPATERLRRLALILRLVRERVEASRDGSLSLTLLDLSIDAESELLAGANAPNAIGRSRSERLVVIGDLLEASYGTGFLSARQRDDLRGRVNALLVEPAVPTVAYLRTMRALERAGAWGHGTVRHAFAEPLQRYIALEPRAAQFADDQLRGSPLLPLLREVGVLGRDAELAAGVGHRIVGETRGGVAGLNPGAAVGRLRFVSEQELDTPGLALAPSDIVVLPRTVSELTPVAGILTLEEGNLLSHVQMLARNLGIPNAALEPGLSAALRILDGKPVLFAVGASGAVVLESLDAVSPAILSLVRKPEASASDVRVDPPVPDLDYRELIPLSELHRGLSGRVVGPKAANLGELARNFPGLVAPAIAIPFGVFAERAAEPKSRLAAAFAAHRAHDIDDAALAAAIEAVRLEIRGLDLTGDLRSRLCTALTSLDAAAFRFSAAESLGVFVRSDTNVEDLPGFTGAGLNETVPNVVGFEAQVEAVARVWSSPFTRRAVAWRSRILTRPEEVYPSVLLMKSVPSDKSGVLVTADLVAGDPGLTASTAWGVGGAVDGETTETLVLRPGGTVEVVADAKAPYRRRLAAGGGVEWVPASSGAVLTPAEQERLRALAVEAEARLSPELGANGEPLPWDIEFGFVAGELTLFQVRPLVERGAVLADRVVAAVMPEAAPGLASVLLAEPPGLIIVRPPAYPPNVNPSPEMSP